MPLGARAELLHECERWASLGVEGHFQGETAWMPYHHLLTEPLAWLVGAKPVEVVAMNSLTVNLQLLLSGFYSPSRHRRKILIEQRAFPSDRHAVLTQILHHGGDPTHDLIEVPTDENGLISEQSIINAIRMHDEELALVLWPGVQYATGQAFDLKKLAHEAHAVGAYFAADLAHAVGNLELKLHDARVDFAVWCSYKYLNAGPGALAGAFVHERHADFFGRRLGGWWGHEQESRFLMGPEFRPIRGAQGWQLSNPSIFAAAPLRASLKLFQAAGWERLQTKSSQLTTHLAKGIQATLDDRIEIITPLTPGSHGCQLSLRLRGGREQGRKLFEQLHALGIICDWREPDVIRAAPVPLYNNLDDVEALLEGLRAF
jgi:kynureninase